MVRGHQVSHALGGGVVLAIGVMAEARMLEGMFPLRGVDKGLR